MSRIIAVANVKGGAGKTTTTGNLAAALAERGHRVLAVDLDPQASLTDWLSGDTGHLDKTIQFAIALAAAPISSFLVTTPEHFDLAPAGHDLLDAEQDLLRGTRRITAVRGALEPLRSNYDFMLIDCPANAGILTGNALAAADEVIIPFLPEYPSLQALDWFLSVIKEIQRKIAPQLHVLGLFLANYDPRLSHTRYIIDYVQKKYGTEAPFFSAAVRQSVTLRQAALHKTSILREAPSSMAAHAYRTLAQEVEDGFGRRPPEDIAALLSQGAEAIGQQDLEKAYLRFSSATFANPGLVEGWLGRGRSARDWEESVRCFAKALALDPGSSEARAELEFKLNAGLVSGSLKEIPQMMAVAHYLSAAGFREFADKAFARVLELAPAHPEAWASRARIAGTSQQAASYYARAVELNPGNDRLRQELETAQSRIKAEAFAMTEYSEAMMRAGAQAEAHAGFLQAAQLDAKNERAWIGCARTTIDVGTALGFINRALEINPQNQEARELSDWLQQLAGHSKSTPRPRYPVVLTLSILALVVLLALLALLFLSAYSGKG